MTRTLASSLVAPLPFRVHPVSSVAEAKCALELRARAYRRHGYVGDLTESMDRPDALDRSGRATSLVAVRKADERVVGTMRMTCNLDGPLELPRGCPDDPCLAEPLVYIDRFAIDPDVAHPVLVPALMKALWLWARGRDARWFVGLALAPLARHYRAWGGLVQRGEGFVLPEYHHERYFLLASPIDEATERMRRENPALGDAFRTAVHADIRVVAQGATWPS